MYMLRRVLLIVVVSILTLGVAACAAYFYPRDIGYQFAQLEEEASSLMGISAIHIESGRWIEYRPQERFKMASTVKLPIAIYLLHLVEKKQLSLEEMIPIEPQDLVPGSGKIGYFLTRPGLIVSVYNLLEPMIAISDNTATDVLLRKIGGPSAVRQFLENRGIHDIWLSRTIMQLFIENSGIKEVPSQPERSLQDWKKRFEEVPESEKIQSYHRSHNDARDTTTPHSMTDLLLRAYKGELLAQEQTALLLEVMSHTETGVDRIPKLLPKKAKVAHKTGSWWNGKEGMYSYNYASDVALITMANGEHIAVSIYTSSDGGSSIAKQEQAIAKATRLVYDAFAGGE